MCVGQEHHSVCGTSNIRVCVVLAISECVDRDTIVCVVLSIRRGNSGGSWELSSKEVLSKIHALFGKNHSFVVIPLRIRMSLSQG